MMNGMPTKQHRASPAGTGGPPRYAYAPTPQNQQDEEERSNADRHLSDIPPEVAGIYAPMLRMRHKREIENSATVQLPPRVIGGLRDQVERVKACQCKKSNCLKLYCDCFSSAIHCNAYCNCSDCCNDGADVHQVVRNKAILLCLEKNPDSFRPRMEPMPGTDEETSSSHSLSFKSRGTRCNCKKSRCLKKYCECYNMSNLCSPSCRCVDCQNTQGNPEREAKIARNPTTASIPAQKAQLQRVTASRASVLGPGINSSKRSLPEGGEGGTRGSELLFKVSDMLPPSLYSIPMELPNGETCASLGFFPVGPAKKRKAGNRPEFTGAKVKSTKNSKTQALSEKELEEKWSLETQDVLGTFGAMKHELLERKRDAGLIEGDIALSLSREYSYYDLVGSAHLASVELDMVDVIASVKEAKKRATNMFAVAKTESSGESTIDAAKEKHLRQAQMPEAMNADEASLLCAEESPWEKQDTSSSSGYGDREIETYVIQASQDAALMRELAHIIRKRAREMSEARMSQNSLAF